MNEYTPAFYASFLNEGIVIPTGAVHKEIEEVLSKDLSKVEEAEEVYFSDILFKGTNASKVAVLVSYEQEEWITVKDRLFLEQILDAVKLRMDTIALINMYKSGFSSIEQVGKKLPDNLIIALGLDPGQTTSFKKNELTDLNSQRYLCMEWGLTDIAVSKERKNLLWKNLKQLFGL